MGQLYADGNDNEVWRVFDTVFYTGDEFQDAVVIFNLYSDAARTSLVTGPYTMAWTEGNTIRGYRAVIPGTVGLTADTVYYGKVHCTGTYADKIYHEPDFNCVKRK